MLDSYNYSCLIRFDAVKAKNLVIRYSFFAGIATIANLITQHLLLNFGHSGGIFSLAIFSGTIVGLVIKYLLDKRWIFYDPETGIRSHGQKFMLYTAMGLFTTAIFWGVETTFWLLYKSDFMRDAGAIIGLIIGYFIKYKLDKRFVFLSFKTGTIQ